MFNRGGNSSKPRIFVDMCEGYISQLSLSKALDSPFIVPRSFDISPSLSRWSSPRFRWQSLRWRSSQNTSSVQVATSWFCERSGGREFHRTGRRAKLKHSYKIMRCYLFYWVLKAAYLKLLLGDDGCRMNYASLFSYLLLNTKRS